jgi:uncharacterized SAM-binding protein YcdF (DUF218 family)
VSAIAALACALAGRVLVLRVPQEAPEVIVSLASHEWERLPEAAAAAVQAPAAVVLLTVPTQVNTRNCHDCEHRVDRLVRLGVSKDRIRVVALTREGTLGEALACRDFLQTIHARSILIVTTPYHTRRAYSVFVHELRGTGISVGVQPATRFSAARPAFWWAAPFDRWYVTYEWTASVYYALRYGIWPSREFNLS